MKNLKCSIFFENNYGIFNAYDNVIDINIESSFDEISQKAIILLNYDGYLKNRDDFFITNTLITKGSKVEIRIAYENNNQDNKITFSGYVSKVSVDDVLKITCEDAMYLVKRNIIKTYSSTGATLVNLVKEITPDYFDDSSVFVKKNVPILNVLDTKNLGIFRAADSSASNIFEILRLDYEIKTWTTIDEYENQIINVNQEIRDFSKPIYDMYFAGPQCNIIRNNLHYKNFYDIDSSIKGSLLNTLSGDSIIKYAKYDVGKEPVLVDDFDGNSIISFIKYDMDEDEFDTLLKNMLINEVHEGFQGSITTFGDELIVLGDRIRLHNSTFKKQNGEFFVKSVNTYFGLSGYRQTIELFS